MMMHTINNNNNKNKIILYRNQRTQILAGGWCWVGSRVGGERGMGK